METKEERFTTYALNGLLEAGDVLTLDRETGVLSHLHQCMIIEQQLLSPSEMYVILALLSSHPDYCPYEIVLSAMTGNSVERCRNRIVAALDIQAVDAVLRPVRNLLGRARMKLHPFGIQIRSMVQSGYILVPLKSGRGMKQAVKHGV